MALIHISNEDDFNTKVLGADKPVLVDFWATWCGPCRMIAPFVEQVGNDYEGKAYVAKVDVDECPELARKYSVQNIPTLIVIKGGEAVERQMGAMPKAKLAQMLDKAL